MTQILHIGSHALIKAFGLDKSDELSVLDGDDGSVSLQNKSSLKNRCIRGIDCTIRVF